MSLAPVGLSVYSRLGHIKRAVEALAKNKFAERTPLYVFSDAAKPGDEEKVRSVRRYIRAIKGFQSLEVFERTENSRVKNNREGISEVLERHGRIIYLEEDVVTAPGFLAFLNNGLDAYEQDLSIVSVSGYRPPIKIPRDYRYEAFVLPRFNAWGFGMWKDRYDRIQMKIRPDEFKRFLKSPKEVAGFKLGGWDMLPMLLAEVEGQIDALDVKIFFQQFKMGMNTIYPTRFLANNTGHDGTGVHCVDSDQFDVELDSSSDTHFNLPAAIPMMDEIIQSNYRFRQVGFASKLKFFLKAGYFFAKT